MENPRDDGRESFPATSFPVTHQPFVSGRFFREESRHLLPSLLSPVRIFDIRRQRGTDKSASISLGTGWRRSLSPIRRMPVHGGPACSSLRDLRAARRTEVSARYSKRAMVYGASA